MAQSRPHDIRLAGPWGVDWVAPEDVPLATLSVGETTFPVDWEAVFGEVYGTARFTRRFNRPTGLDERTRVWLCVPDYHGMLSVELNQRVLAILPEEDLPVRIDITESIRPHNRLVLEVTSGPATETVEKASDERQPVALSIVEETQ